MEIKVNIRKNTVLASLYGELDHHTAKEVKTLIEEVIKNNQVNNLVLDFSNLSFMDSSGIGVIVGRYKLISSLGGRIAIVGAKGNVKRLLYMSGINKIVEVFDCTDHALKSLQEVNF
ncbi:MAG: anti-sigma F factor antagonist [Clostridia bacterium]|nr:anti-sigma F factor antagonist [Clostridia bacterium]